MADVVSAYVSNNPVPASELSSLIGQIYRSLDLLRSDLSTQATGEQLKPAVPIKKSVTPDFIISLESGKKFKSLKRHLRVSYGLSPEEYRAKWGLPADYPMVAPNYTVWRSLLAKKYGPGLKPREIEKLASKKTRTAPNEYSREVRKTSDARK